MLLGQGQGGINTNLQQQEVGPRKAALMNLGTSDIGMPELNSCVSYSTVTLLARFLGLSTSHPSSTAM